MKKLLFILLLFCSLAFRPVPQGVHAGDEKEWNAYVEYCNEYVPIYIYQWAKFHIKQNNIGQWINNSGQYVIDTTYKVHWYTPKIPTYAEPKYKSYVQDAPECDIDEHTIGIVHQRFVRQRRHTVADFYNYWMTDSIKH